jgi:hypothetical protein
MADQLKINWSANKQMETHLQAIGVKFIVKKLRFPTDFDIPRSREMQTRFEALIDEVHAESLAVSISQTKLVERFVCFPAELGFKGNLIPDGIHRSRGLEILVEMGDLPSEFDCEVYYIDTQDKMLRELIARSCNTVGVKKGLRDDVVVKNAQHMLSTHNMSVSSLAVYFHIKESTLAGRLAVETQKKELSEEGLVDVAKLKISAIKEIAKIKGNKNLKFQTAHLIVQHNQAANGEVVKRIVNQVVQACTDSGEQAAKAALADWKTRLQIASDKRKPATNEGKCRKPRTKFWQYMHTFHNFLLEGNHGKECTTVEHLGFTDPHDVSEARDHWRELWKTMESIWSNYEKARAEKARAEKAKSSQPTAKRINQQKRRR